MEEFLSAPFTWFMNLWQTLVSLMNWGWNFMSYSFTIDGGFWTKILNQEPLTVSAWNLLGGVNLSALIIYKIIKG